MAEPIRVQITSGSRNQTDGNVNGQNPANNTEVKAVGAMDTLKSLGAVQLANQVIASGKSIANYALSQYGNYTGDYLTQQRIDDAVEGLNKIVSYGTTLAGGAIVGGAVGLVVAASGILITEATNQVLNYNTYKLSNKRTNQEASFNSSLIGSILTDGNR